MDTNHTSMNNALSPLSTTPRKKKLSSNKFVLCFVVLLIFVTVGRAEMVTDNFDTPQDYAASLAGTIWDGLKITGAAGTIVACETTSTPGALTFSSSGTDTASSALLYRIVPADTDFEATLKVVDGTWVPFNMGFVNWHSAGLTAGLDANNWVSVYYFSNPQWTATFIGRSVENGAEDNLNTGTVGVDPDNNIDTYPHTKLARVGNDFLRYYSADGLDWTLFSQHTRNDLAGVELEVGLRHAMHTGNTGTAIFDEFTLSMPSIPEPPTVAITSIVYQGGGTWELTLEGEASTGYEFRSSPTLDFTPGALVENLAAGADPVGTIGGTNHSVLTTDVNGDGTVRMMLTGNPADFVRAQIPPPVTVFSEDFESESTLPLLGWDTDANPADTATTTWDLGTPSIVGPVPPGVPLPSDSNCVGTNLAANYGLSSDIWLRTPPIDLSTATGATLTFQHWVDIDPFENADKGTVRVLDASALPTVSVLETLGAPITGLSPTGWVGFSADLTAASVGNSVVLEFVFVSDNDDDMGAAVSSGWYIDDVVVTTPAP